ncbi:DNA-directed RNA polymerase subunit L [Candidatus Woesearchaeota archaeon]|nr:DNA-directed RNA polymerase subunit L [Candidatus Woesearchaeota archaeon]
MEINVLEHEKNRLKFEIMEETHTLANLITKELWNDSDVTVSGYHLKHPQTSHVTLLIETTKKDPKKVLLDTIADIKKKSTEFRTQFKKAVK